MVFQKHRQANVFQSSSGAAIPVTDRDIRPFVSGRQFYRPMMLKKSYHLFLAEHPQIRPMR